MAAVDVESVTLGVNQEVINRKSVETGGEEGEVAAFVYREVTQEHRWRWYAALSCRNLSCFTIRLKSKADLYLSRGCTILAAGSPKPGETTGEGGGAYDPAGPAQLWEAYQDYGHNHWPNSLFYG